MNRVLMSFSLVMACAMLSCGPKAENPEKYTYTLQAVKLVLDSQISAWSKGDLDGFMNGYVQDSSVRFITAKKVKNSWQQILTDYKKGYPTQEAMGNLDFILDEVRWLDSNAGISQVIGRWQVIQESSGGKSLEVQVVDTLSGRFSLIFKGTDKGPRIAVDCTW